MKVTKRVIAIAISALMIFCALPFSIVASAASVKSASVICGDLTFVVPEVIYLTPNGMSWRSDTVSTFQIYVNNTQSYGCDTGLYTSTGTTGNIYYTLSGASAATISYTFYDENLSSTPLSGGSVTLSSPSITSGSSVNITAGTSPSLAAATNGCYIQWCLSYTDPSDNIAKKAYAYTYVYKPYVVPVAAGSDAGTGTSGGANWAGAITWISGIHSISTKVNSYIVDCDDWDGGGHGATNSTGNEGFSAFISFSQSAKTGSAGTSSVNGNKAKISKSSWKYSTAGATDWYCSFYSGDSNAKFGMVSNSSQGTYIGSNNAFNVENLDWAKYRANKENIQAVGLGSSVGNIIIDTSRYTDLQQIPNLAIGLVVTDDEDSGSNTGTWYIGDYTDESGVWTGTRNQQWHKDSDNRSKYYNDVRYKIAGQGSGATDCSYDETEGIRYAGAWPRTLLGSTSSQGATYRYTVKGFYGNKDGGYYASSHTMVDLRATYYNKATLRSAVANATKAMAKLGVNGGSAGTLTSCYFDADADYKWTAFQTAYKNAVIGLTKLDSTLDPDTLATSLNTALDGLCTKYTLDGNGGTLNTSTLDYYVDVGTSTPGVNQSVSVTPSTSITGTRTGYTFAGWSTSSTGTASSSVTVGYNNTVYAIWSKNSYDISYDANNGSVSTSKITVPYADPLPTNDPSRTGYTFTGWTYTGNSAAYTGTTMPAYNLTATASWNAITYSVKYNANGGLGSMSNSGHTYDTAANLTANAFTRTGYTFKGWDTSSAGTSVVYTDKASVKNLTATQGAIFNLYAVWNINSYTITYNANGGTGASASQTLNYGASIPTNTPTRDGYYFEGWVYSGNGTTYSGSTMPAYNLTATASWIKGVNDDSYVIDYGTPVTCDVLSNDATGAALKSVSSGTGYTASISGGKIIFTPTEATSGIITFTYTATYKSTDYVGTVKIIPATNVYYEESFITFTDSSPAVWKEAGTQQSSITQTVDSLYGSDSAYTNTTAYSLGTAKYVTVAKGNKGATAQFTFTGTGFDFYSLMSGSTGTALVDIYQGTDTSGTQVDSLVVDTYFGYSYGQLYLKDGKVSLDSAGTPIYYADDAHPGEFFIRGTLMGTTAVTDAGYAFGWVQGAISNVTIYQVPVISMMNLDYGTYTVVIEPRYSKAYDNTGAGKYDFYVDGYRVYNPIDPAAVTSGTDAYTAYTADNEYNPTYQTLHSLISDSTQLAFLETYENEANVSEYEDIGPNNEVYLASGQSISFSLTTKSSVIPAKLSVGVKTAEGGTGYLTVSCGSKGDSLTINGTSDIYRDITSCVDWTQQSDGTYKSGTIVLYNSASTIISLTKLKWSYGSSSSSAKSTDLIFSFDDEDLVKVNAMITAASKPDSISSDGVTLAWDKSSVALGETATLTITAPSTFERAYYGAEVIPGYTENEDGTRSWTCTCTPTELQNVIYDVTLEDANGYKTDAIASAELKVIAPEVDINDAEISWEKDAVKVGEEAVMTVTTPADIVRVTVGDKEITDFTLTDGKKVFTYKVTNDTAGKYVYSVSMTETFGYTSRNVNSPALTVEQYVVKTDGITAKWQNESVKAGEKAVLVITTPADITSVTVAGKTVTDSTVLEDGTKQFTIEIDTSSQGENSYAVTVTDGKGMTSASVATDILTITAAEAAVPDSDTDTDGNTDDNTGSSTEEENLSFWQKLVKAFVSFWKWLVSLVKGLVK